MTGKGVRSGVFITALFLLSLLFPLGSPDSEALDLPSRGPGSDISVTITSHTDNQTVLMEEQQISVRLENSGTLNFTDPVYARLTIWFPANGTPPEKVYDENYSANNTLENVGNFTQAAFPPWTPLSSGRYLVRAETNVSDDNPGNDTAEITLRVFSGDEVGVDVWVAGTRKQYIPPGLGTTSIGYEPYIFRLQNQGIRNDTFDVTVDSEWALDTYIKTVGPLKPGEISQDIPVDVQVPSNADYSSLDRLTLYARSRNDPAVVDSDNVTTYTVSLPSVSISVFPDLREAFPGGEPVKFGFTITNTGNGPDRYYVSALAKPSNWIAGLDQSSDYFVSLDAGRSRTVFATIQVPELSYDDMEDDLTYYGASGALVLRVESPSSGVQASAQGVVSVGLIHTVQIEIGNRTQVKNCIADEIQNVEFPVSVRPVDNLLTGGGQDMTVNLTLPYGPHGVEFQPQWSETYNGSESERWYGNISDRQLDLEGGAWDRNLEMRVVVPEFPMHGRANVVLRAEPLTNESFTGTVVPREMNASVLIRPLIDFELEPQFRRNYTGMPGKRVWIPFNITNTGNTWDSYTGTAKAVVPEGSTLSVLDWRIEFPEGVAAGPLLPSLFDPVNTETNTTLWLRVLVPEEAPIGESVEITLIVGSTSSFMYQEVPEKRSASVNITVIQGFGIDLEPEESSRMASPDERVQYRLNITNTGNGLDMFLIEATEPTVEGWTVELEEREIRLASRISSTFSIWVRPSLNASADSLLAIRVRGTSFGNPSIFDDVWINTTVRYVGGAVLEVPDISQSLIWRRPGEIATFLLDLTNTGNGNDTFDLSLSVENGGWTAVIDTGGGEGGSSASLFLARGQSARVRVNVTSPPLSDAGSYQDLVDLGIHAGMKVSTLIRATAGKDPELYHFRNVTVGVLQEYRAHIELDKGVSSDGEILVGEERFVDVVLRNLGNGKDNLSLLPRGSSRHLMWLDLYSGPYDLDPYREQVIEALVSPLERDLPLYGEVLSYSIDALAGDNNTYRTVDMELRIAMTRLMTDQIRLDLGTVGQVELVICNMPDPGEAPIPGIPFINNYEVHTYLDTDGDFSDGWEVTTPYRYSNISRPYEKSTVMISIRAPPNLVSYSYLGSIVIDIDGGNGKEERRQATSYGVYFDAFINRDGTSFSNLYEGEKGRAYIRIVTAGTRTQDNVTVLVRVGGEEVGRFYTGRADPQDYVQGEQELLLTVEFDLPALKWYEKGKQWDIEIVIDPDDEIVENRVTGRGVSEENNVLVKEFNVKNFTPPVPFLLLGLLGLILATAGGVMGFFFVERRNSWYLLLLSLGLSGLFSLLFYVPLEETSSIATANYLAAAVILLEFLFIVPVMIFLFTRSGDSYILYKLRKHRGALEDGKDGFETTRTMVKPYVIAFAGGLIAALCPLLIWILPSHINSGSVSILDILVNGDAFLPVWSILIIVPVLSLAIQALLVELKRSSLRSLIRAGDELERLKLEIKEGLD